MNRVTWPSGRRIANDSGSGVCGTSPPRMLSSQAIDSGIVSTAAATPSCGQRLAEPGALRRRRSRRRIASGCGTTGAIGAAGRPGPDLVERVVAQPRASSAPALSTAGAQPLDLVRRVQPGVVADDLALVQRRREPARRRLVDQMADLERARIDLGAGLQRVTPIDKERRALAQHDRHAGRAGKAGQPGQPLAAWRHIFALMLVGARHDEAGETVAPPVLARNSLSRVGRGSASKILGAGRRRDATAASSAFSASSAAASPGGVGLGDQRMPARADFGRCGQHAGDQRLDPLEIEGGPRLGQQSRQPIPIRSRAMRQLIAYSRWSAYAV